jgi:class 3 adenylate cyclase/tetratricopeptide (TPR) repeat protein
MAACSQCGSELPPEARFCSACGAAVGARRGEERKVVTVLFADIVDSTGLGDGRDPEDVRAAVRPQLEQMRTELERHGGTFEKFVGDAVMAVFGAPISHEDDPERAVRAALAIRDSVPGVRVGVNTGEAVVQLGAASGAGEGIATGDVVTTTFRIEEGAQTDTVVVGESTYRATQGAVEYGERRLLHARGKAEPVAVYEAQRVTAELRPAYEGPPLAPLVGRKEELSLILDTLSRAKRDRTVQLVTLVGVPGIGKSRLVWELQRALTDDPGLVTWRRGRCLPYGDGVTFWALGEMVKAQAAVLETDDAPTAEGKLARAVRDLAADPREAEWIEANLRPLLALGNEDIPQFETRDEAFSAWRRFFELLGDWGPLVLVFEDLHWADDGLLDFIDHVADWATGSAMLLLCTARPEVRERRPAWGARSNAATVALAPLSDDDTAHLVSFLLHQTLVPAELQQTLLARAEGNPLYAEEFVRMLVDRGDLYRSDGGWQLKSSDIPVPDSVQGIIAARLDALAPDEKELVQDAAVVGRYFWPGAVASISGRAVGEVETVLRSLASRELMRRRGSSTVAGEQQFAFHHALVRDVAYAQMPRARRAEKHRLAAAWFEALGRPDDHAELIAHHWVMALETAEASPADVARARSALGRAGQRALNLNAYATAARHFERALGLAAEPDVDLMLAFGHALYYAEARGEDELSAARDLLIELGDRGRAAEAQSMLAWLAWYAGRGDDAFARVQRALELAEGLEAGRSKAEVLTSAARFYAVADRPHEALPVARDALAMSEAIGAGDLAAVCLTYIGTSRAAVGELAGIEDLSRAVEVAKSANAPEEEMRALVNTAALRIGLGELATGFELQAEAREGARRYGLTRGLLWLERELAAECYLTGRWDDAVRIVDACLDGDTQPHYLDGFCAIARGQIKLARGDLAGAVADARRALDQGHAAKDAQVLYPALAFSAEAFLRSGDESRAIELVDELLAALTGEELLTTGIAWPRLARIGARVGRVDELLEASKRIRTRTRWIDAAELHLTGHPEAAADVYAAIGSLPDEAYARIAAGESEKPLAFFSSVGGAEEVNAAARAFAVTA